MIPEDEEEEKMSDVKMEYPQLQLDGQLCFPLYAAARKVVNEYNPLLKPYGLTYTQYIVFLALWEQENGKMKVGDLGRRLYLDCGTLTPLLKKMEVKGLINRRRSETDERSLIVSLTGAGEALKDKALSVPQQMASCVCLEPEEARELYRILYKLLK